jgi:hypothetical protein
MKRSDHVAGTPRAYSPAEGSAWLSSARAPLFRALALSEMLDHGGGLASRIAEALTEIDALERSLRENGLGRSEPIHPERRKKPRGYAPTGPR